MIFELLLTVSAWRKGWGPLALLPLAIGLPLGVLAASAANSLAPAVVADVAIYISLLTMIAKGHRKSTGTAVPPPPAQMPRVPMA